MRNVLYLSLHVGLVHSFIVFRLQNLKGILWISIERSMKVSGIVYVFIGFVVRDWS